MRSFCGFVLVLVTVWSATGCDSKPGPSGAAAGDSSNQRDANAAPQAMANVAPRAAERPTLDQVIPDELAASQPTASAQADATLAARHKAGIEQTIIALELNTAILRTIVDEPSARAAAPKLKLARARLDQVGKEVNALGPIPRRDSALLTTPLGQRVIEATNAMTAELQRIGADPVLNDALRRGMSAPQ